MAVLRSINAVSMPYWPSMLAIKAPHGPAPTMATSTWIVSLDDEARFISSSLKDRLPVDFDGGPGHYFVQLPYDMFANRTTA